MFLIIFLNVTYTFFEGAVILNVISVPVIILLLYSIEVETKIMRKK